MGKFKGYLLLFLLIWLNFPANAESRSIFIEGIALSASHRTFFLENFNLEGRASGYEIVNNRAAAAYILRFEVVPNMITFEDGTQEPAPPEEDQFLILINLIDNSTEEELVSFGYTYSEVEEMYEYTQFLFLRAALNIPASESPESTEMLVEIIDDSWRNKWLYVRASIDYPITFFQLKSDGLFGGSAVYIGDINNLRPGDWSPIDNRTTALPAVTVGAQVMILDWLSLGPSFQAIFFERDRLFTAGVGAELMFPIKAIRNIMLTPFAAFSYPLIPPPGFNKFPLYTVGGGMQISIKQGKMGALFVDLRYMHSLHDAILKNPYGEYYPNPSLIHFRRHVIGIGAGYKIGFFDR